MRYKRYKPEFLSIKSTLCETLKLTMLHSDRLRIWRLHYGRFRFFGPIKIFVLFKHVVCLPMMMSTSPWRSRVGLADFCTLE